MKTYIALLRGINVSGQKLIKMAELKKLFQKTGFTDVATYIQSGNIIFKSSERNKNTISKLIISAISDRYRFEVPVMVIDSNELENIINKNPFVNRRNENPGFLHATLLDKIPEVSNIELIKNIVSGKDEFEIVGNVIYLFCPNGYGRTKYTNNFFENKLKTRATTRNWKTLNKLSEIAKS